MKDAPEHCASGKLRLHVGAALSAGARVEPSPDQAHYLLTVMRAREGAAVLLFNGRDGEWRARIAETGKKSCTLVVEAQTRPFEPLPDVWLLFAPVKRARIDYIAQKATEMGAGAIQPVLTARTQVARVNEARLRANAVEAAEQCGLVAVPEVRAPLPLGDLLDRWQHIAPGRRILFCDEAAGAGATLGTLQALAAEGGRPPSRGWAILIGPEGGFDAAERARLRARDDTAALSLGPRIVRADTAAVAALAAFQLVLGDWRPDEGKD